MNNRRILLIDTNFPINSRNNRIIDSLSKIVGQNIKVVAWERNKNKNKNTTDEIYSIFYRKAPLGDKMSKIKSLYDFLKYIKSIVDSYNPKIVIASHWDSLILASLIKRKGQVLIYENLDMPSGGFPIKGILSFIERICLRKVDAISHASRFYIPFYKNFKGKQILLENKLPRVAIAKQHDNEIKDGPLKMMFNGSIRYPETMINLIEAIGNNLNIEFSIYGYPAGKDGDLILETAKKYRNIEYKGPYAYKDIPQLYATADVVWGVYPSNDFNVKYAISNKFHESIIYEVPGIFAKDTKLGQYVEDKGIGFTVNSYSVDLIKSFFDNLVMNKKNLLSNVRNNIKTELKEGFVDWESEFIDFGNYIKNLVSECKLE